MILRVWLINFVCIILISFWVKCINSAANATSAFLLIHLLHFLQWLYFILSFLTLFRLLLRCHIWSLQTLKSHSDYCVYNRIKSNVGAILIYDLLWKGWWYLVRLWCLLYILILQLRPCRLSNRILQCILKFLFKPLINLFQDLATLGGLRDDRLRVILLLVEPLCCGL